MNEDRRKLIAELSSELAPLPHAGKTFWTSSVWLLGAGFTATFIIAATGPFRAGSLQRLQVHPQFLIESLIGVAAIAALGFAAFRSGIPSPTPIMRQASMPIALLCVWIGMYVYGLNAPALELSMAGKRDHCYLEALVYGAPGLIFGMVAIRRLYPLHGAWSGALLGVSAGAMPALIMQFACMYVPLHIIVFHVLPGLALALIGGITGFFLLRPR